MNEQELFYFCPSALSQGWRNLLRVRAQIVHKFQRNFSNAHWNFEDKIKVLESSIIIIYCIIIIIIIIIITAY